MTAAQVQRRINFWIVKLGMTEWTITFSEEPSPGNNSATCHWSWDYHTADIRFEEGWQKWSLQWLDEMIVHELLHPMFRELHVAQIHLARCLPKTMGKFVDLTLEHHVESPLDRIAKVLVRLGRK